MYKSSKKKINGGVFEKAIVTTDRELRNKGRWWSKDEFVDVCNIYTSYTLKDIDELRFIAEKYIKIRDHIKNKKPESTIREHPSISSLLETISHINDVQELQQRIGNPTFIQSIIQNKITDNTYTKDIEDIKNYINKLKNKIELQLFNNSQCDNSSIIEVNIVYEKYSSKTREVISRIIERQSLVEKNIKNTQIFLNDIAAYITTQLGNKEVYISYWYDELFTPSQGDKERSINQSINRLLFDQSKSKLEKATKIGKEYTYPEDLDEETIKRDIQIAEKKVKESPPKKFNLLDWRNGGGNENKYANYKGRQYIVRIGSKGGKYILVGTDKKKVYI